MTDEEPSPRKKRAKEPAVANQVPADWTTTQATFDAEPIQRQEEATLRLPIQPEVGTEGGPVSPELEDAIHGSLPGGESLDTDTREHMEAQFGHDFGQVQVHTDHEADVLSRRLGATAFTSGSDIFFREGAYQPGSPQSDPLLAHELTHVAQQHGTSPSGPLTVGPAGDSHEQEADTLSAAAAREAGSPGSTRAAAAPPTHGAAASHGAVQRQPAPSTTGFSADLAEELDREAAPHLPPFSVEWVGLVDYGPREENRNKPRPQEAVDKQTIHQTVWVGDTLGIVAVVGGLPNAKSAGLEAVGMGFGIGGGAADVDIAKPRWNTDTDCVWDIVAQQPGRMSLSFSIVSPDGTQEYQYNVHLTVAADVGYFKGRCSTAQTALEGMYRDALTWFGECYENYKKGYDNHNAALAEQRGAQELAGELLFGVLFAAVGGAAAGWVEHKLEHAFEAGKILKNAFSTAQQQGMVTEAAKELTLHVTKLPGELGKKGGEGKEGGEGGEGGGDMYAPVTIDPLAWKFSMELALHRELHQVDQELRRAQLLADHAAAFQPDYVFDWDPYNVMIQGAELDGKPIDKLGPVPTELEYEALCWAKWLENYAYVITYMPGDVLGGSFYSVSGNVARKLRKRINAVAEKFSEDADTWIERYGGALKERLEKEVEEKND
jgi:hypothetical protein